MKKILMVLVAGGIAIAGTGCGRQCKKAREEILEPAQVVTAYLQANPDGETLAMTGCPMILTQFERLPHGARVIRRIAETRFTHTESHCLYWRTEYRYDCRYAGPYRRPVCHAYPYTYCGQWEYDVIREPGYATAVELSQKLDDLYARTHRMCGQASAGNYDGAYRESRELLAYIVGEVKPDGDRVYALACRQ
jgi:hypothetical protein